jgi:hypothetical protein
MHVTLFYGHKESLLSGFTSHRDNFEPWWSFQQRNGVWLWDSPVTNSARKAVRLVAVQWMCCEFELDEALSISFMGIFWYENWRIALGLFSFDQHPNWFSFAVGTHWPDWLFFVSHLAHREEIAETAKNYPRSPIIGQCP